MENDEDLPQHDSSSADLPDSLSPPDPQIAPDSLDLSAALSPSGALGAFGEPATLPDALPAPVAAPEQPALPLRERSRRGLCLYTSAGAAAIFVLLCASLGVVALRAALGTAGAQQRGASTDEASRIAILTRAGSGTVTPLPGATFPPLPNAVIAFGGGATSTTKRQCNGPAALDPVTFVLDNSHSTISVDWWIQITDTTPDGKLLWASGAPPYGTLRAGQSTVVELDPDPTLCAQLASATRPVTYHATVFYGGVGGFAVSVVVVPLGPGQQQVAQAASA